MSIRQKTAYMLGSQVLSVLVGLVNSVVVARYLGPEARGVFIMANLVVQVAVIFGIGGFGGAYVYLAGKRSHGLDVLAGASTLMAVTFGVTAAVVTLGLHPLLGDSVFKGFVQPYLWIVSASIPFAYLGHMYSSLLLGIDRVRTLALVQSVLSILTLGVNAWVLIILQLGLEAMMWVGLGTWVAMAVGFAVPTLVATRLRVDRRSTSEALGDAFGYGRAAYFGFVANQFWLRADAFMLNAISGPAAVGQYSLATSIAERLWIVDSAVGQAVYPSVIGSSTEMARDLVTRSTRIIVLATGGLSFVLALAAPWLVPALYGADYAPAVTPLILLLPGVIALAVSRVITGYFSGHLGQPGVTTRVSLAVLLVSAVLYLALIPIAGASGAAMASSCSYLSALAAYCYLLKREAGIGVRAVLVPKREDFTYLTELTKAIGRRMGLRD